MVVILIITLVISCPTRFRTAKNTIYLTVSDPLDLVNVLVKMCFCFKTFYQHSSKITNKFRILIWSSKIFYIKLMTLDIQITMFNLLTIGIVTSENIWHWVWSGAVCACNLTVDDLLIPPSGLKSTSWCRLWFSVLVISQA